MQEYRRGELVFDVIDAGPVDGPVVTLLHGFPQFNTSWDGVLRHLVAQGYRCLAPNQRGYSVALGPSRPATVVAGAKVRGLIPASPWRRSEAATVLPDIVSPAVRSSARMRGVPYTPSGPVCDAATWASRSARHW